ncbi:MAG: imidazole glycerol phosphate synthase subunit HisH, partial [Planctomycetes bacterium]|nr:imidazole glycerol phosphate synthase subunit HisH [Planctomycetota bacterium]
EILIVPTGIANTASVAAAFARLGAATRLGGEPDEIERAERVVLPGVGTFGAAMARLDDLGLVATLRTRILTGRATLAICLGLQLLCRASEESPGVAGLGVIDATIARFPSSVRVPQLGWNRVQPVASELIEPGVALFANSYRLTALPAGWAGATTEHGGGFASALERGPVLACQFHPEISGAWGQRLLARWLQRSAEVA